MIPAATAPLASRLRVPGYLILGIATILPLIDLLIQVWPLRVGTLAWRFGFVGLFSDRVSAPILLLFLMYALALASGDRKVMIFIAAVSALLALFLLSGMGSFALDTLQMKRRVPPAQVAKFNVTAVQAMAKLGLQALSALVLSVSIFNTIRKAPKVVPARGEGRGQSSLIVGRSPTAARASAAPVAAAPVAAIDPTESTPPRADDE